MSNKKTDLWHQQTSFSRQLSVISPSEKYRAVLRSSNDKQFIEVWQNENLSKIVDLNALDIHGDVYADGTNVKIKISYYKLTFRRISVI